MLELQHIGKTFQGRVASVSVLRDVSLTLKPATFTTVHGPSGCGKTTLLLIAGGLLKPDTGDVRMEGAPFYHLSSEERARTRAREIGFVFQQFHLIPYLTVLQNVLTPNLALSYPEAGSRALALIEHFGLSSRFNHLPGELSTGERQRVALARALMNRPRIILADEPTGNLDIENARRVLDALLDFARQGGTVLMVSHNVLMDSPEQQVLYMRDGHLLTGEKPARRTQPKNKKGNHR